MTTIVHCYNHQYPTGLSDFLRGSLYLLATFPGRVHVCVSHHPKFSRHVEPGPPGPCAFDHDELIPMFRSAGPLRSHVDMACENQNIYVHTNVEWDRERDRDPELAQGPVQYILGLLRWRPSVLRHLSAFEGLDFGVVHIRLPDRFFRPGEDPTGPEMGALLGLVGDAVLAQKCDRRSLLVLCNHAGVAGRVRTALGTSSSVAPSLVSGRGGPVHTLDADTDADDRYGATLADWALVGRARRILQFSALQPVGRSGFSDVPAVLYSVPIVHHDLRSIILPDD